MSVPADGVVFLCESSVRNVFNLRFGFSVALSADNLLWRNTLWPLYTLYVSVVLFVVATTGLFIVQQVIFAFHNNNNTTKRRKYSKYAEYANMMMTEVCAASVCRL